MHLREINSKQTFIHINKSKKKYILMNKLIVTVHVYKNLY